MKAILEGLLFVVGDDGLTLEQVSNILEIDLEQTKEIINSLKKDYEEDNRGIRIDFLGNTLKLTTKQEHKEYYKRLIEEDNRCLSQAALETLVIVAYNEPITRLKVEDIRGINSSSMMRKLVAKGLLKEVGRSDSIGKPILYKTTNEFLDYFGLSSKEELPKIEEIKEIEKEEDLFSLRYKEESIN